MPHIKYWFRSTAIVAALTAAVSILTTLAGLTSVITGSGFQILTVVMTALALFGWYTAAKSEQERDEGKLQSDEDRRILADIREHMALTAQVGATANLEPLTNDQIRTRVAALAGRLRAFEALGRAARDRAHHGAYHPGDTPEARHARWEDMLRRSDEQSNEQRRQFRTDLLPEALALREEMRRRLQMFPPFPVDHRTTALDYGMLAGVAPAADAADHLEALARKLP